MQKSRTLLDRFGKTVRTFRVKRGFTQAELAARAGMTQKHLGELERGVAEASITAIVALARALEMRAGDLVPDDQRHVSASARPSQVSSRAAGNGSGRGGRTTNRDGVRRRGQD